MGSGLQLSPNTNEAERYVNDTYMVTCTGADTANTTWIGPDGKAIRQTKGRKHVEERTVQGHSVSLVFERIERSDRGNYTCTSVINGDVVKLFFKLIVVKPISFLGSFSEQNVTEHSNQLVRCEVSGDPSPSVVWQVNKKHPRGPRYKFMAGGLYIANITHEDEGTYTCTAFQVTSKTSNFKAQTITLYVLHKPRWPESNRSEGDASYGYKGGVANITCQAYGRPLPEYTWSRGNQSLDPITTNVVTHDEKSVLQVKMINDSVLGEYTCVAKNGLGTIIKMITLREGTRPVPPTHFTLYAVGVYSAQFNIYGPPKEQVLGYRIQFIKNSPSYSLDNGDYQDVYVKDGLPFTIINLTENTQYVYRVATRNPAGISLYSNEAYFKTREASASVSNLYNVPNNLITFICWVLLGLWNR